MTDKKLTYVVNELDCGDEPEEFRAWLEENAPEHVTVEWRERTGGVGDGMFDEDRDLIDKNTYVDPWESFCNGRPRGER